jgi:hypothetical protein
VSRSRAKATRKFRMETNPVSPSAIQP